MPRFADVVESTVETLSLNPRAKVDEESVIQASRLVGCCFVYNAILFESTSHSYMRVVFKNVSFEFPTLFLCLGLRRNPRREKSRRA